MLLMASKPVDFLNKPSHSRLKLSRRKITQSAIMPTLLGETLGYLSEDYAHMLYLW